MKYIHRYVNGSRFHAITLSPPGVDNWTFYDRGEYFTFIFSPGSVDIIRMIIVFHGLIFLLH